MSRLRENNKQVNYLLRDHVLGSDPIVHCKNLHHKRDAIGYVINNERHGQNSLEQFNPKPRVSLNWTNLPLPFPLSILKISLWSHSIPECNKSETCFGRQLAQRNPEMIRASNGDFQALTATMAMTITQSDQERGIAGQLLRKRRVHIHKLDLHPPPIIEKTQKQQWCNSNTTQGGGACIHVPSMPSPM